MARELHTYTEPNWAAIYARVSDKSQAEEDKTSLGEQIGDMEAYCARKGLRIVARYQEVGRGWSKKRPEFQRMLADAREGRFDVIVCWKSDRLSRGMFPATALMEVVEAYQLRIESIMDAIDMKTFGLMAAIGKIELDNFRERAAMGKRGAAKQGRISTGRPPYGYRVDPTGRPEVDEAQADVVRRIFHDYVHKGLGAQRIAWDLTDEDVPTASGGRTWHESVVQRLLANPVYKGTWAYGQTRNIASDEGNRVFAHPADTWIEVPVPPLVDAELWERAQAAKRARYSSAKRNTKAVYLLQHLLRCTECGRKFRAPRPLAHPRHAGRKASHVRLEGPSALLLLHGERPAPAMPGEAHHQGGAVGRARLGRGQRGAAGAKRHHRRHRRARGTGRRVSGAGTGPGQSGTCGRFSGRRSGSSGCTSPTRSARRCSTSSGSSSRNERNTCGPRWRTTGRARRRRRRGSRSPRVCRPGPSR